MDTPRLPSWDAVSTDPEWSTVPADTQAALFDTWRDLAETDIDLETADPNELRQFSVFNDVRANQIATGQGTSPQLDREGAATQVELLHKGLEERLKRAVSTSKDAEEDWTVRLGEDGTLEVNPFLAAAGYDAYKKAVLGSAATKREQIRALSEYRMARAVALNDLAQEAQSKNLSLIGKLFGSDEYKDGTDIEAAKMYIHPKDIASVKETGQIPRLNDPALGDDIAYRWLSKRGLSEYADAILDGKADDLKAELTKSYGDALADQPGFWNENIKYRKLSDGDVVFNPAWLQSADAASIESTLKEAGLTGGEVARAKAEAEVEKENFAGKVVNDLLGNKSMYPGLGAVITERIFAPKSAEFRRWAAANRDKYETNAELLDGFFDYTKDPGFVEGLRRLTYNNNPFGIMSTLVEMVTNDGEFFSPVNTINEFSASLFEGAQRAPEVLGETLTGLYVTAGGSLPGMDHAESVEVLSLGEEARQGQDALFGSASKWGRIIGQEVGMIVGTMGIGTGARLGARALTSASEALTGMEVRAAQRAMATMSGGGANAIGREIGETMARGAYFTFQAGRSAESMYRDAFRAYREEGLANGLEEGMADEQARARALWPAIGAGVVTGVLMKTIGGGVESLFSKQGLHTLSFRQVREVAGDKVFGNVFRDRGARVATLKALAPFLKESGKEATEEFLDELTQGFIQMGTFNPDMSVGDAFGGALQAAVVGGILGTAGAVRAEPGTTEQMDAFRTRMEQYLQQTAADIQASRPDSEVAAVLREARIVPPSEENDTIEGTTAPAGIGELINQAVAIRDNANLTDEKKTKALQSLASTLEKVGATAEAQQLFSLVSGIPQGSPTVAGSAPEKKGKPSTYQQVAAELDPILSWYNEAPDAPQPVDSDGNPRELAITNSRTGLHAAIDEAFADEPSAPDQETFKAMADLVVGTARLLSETYRSADIRVGSDVKNRNAAEQNTAQAVRMVKDMVEGVEKATLQLREARAAGDTEAANKAAATIRDIVRKSYGATSKNGGARNRLNKALREEAKAIEIASLLQGNAFPEVERIKALVAFRDDGAPVLRTEKQIRNGIVQALAPAEEVVVEEEVAPEPAEAAEPVATPATEEQITPTEDGQDIQGQEGPPAVAPETQEDAAEPAPVETPAEPGRTVVEDTAEAEAAAAAEEQERQQKEETTNRIRAERLEKGGAYYGMPFNGIGDLAGSGLTNAEKASLLEDINNEIATRWAAPTPEGLVLSSRIAASARYRTGKVNGVPVFVNDPRILAGNLNLSDPGTAIEVPAGIENVNPNIITAGTRVLGVVTEVTAAEYKAATGTEWDGDVIDGRVMVLAGRDNLTNLLADIKNRQAAARNRAGGSVPKRLAVDTLMDGLDMSKALTKEEKAWVGGVDSEGKPKPYRGKNWLNDLVAAFGLQGASIGAGPEAVALAILKNRIEKSGAETPADRMKWIKDNILSNPATAPLIEILQASRSTVLGPKNTTIGRRVENLLGAENIPSALGEKSAHEIARARVERIGRLEEQNRRAEAASRQELTIDTGVAEQLSDAVVASPAETSEPEPDREPTYAEYLFDKGAAVVRNWANSLRLGTWGGPALLKGMSEAEASAIVGAAFLDFAADEQGAEIRQVIGSATPYNREQVLALIEAELNKAAFSRSAAAAELEGRTLLEFDELGIYDRMSGAALLETVRRAASGVSEPRYAALYQMLLDNPALLDGVRVRVISEPRLQWAGRYRKGNLVLNTAYQNGRGTSDLLVHELLHHAMRGMVLNPTTDAQRAFLERKQAELKWARAALINMERSYTRGLGYIADLTQRLATNLSLGRVRASLGRRDHPLLDGVDLQAADEATLRDLFRQIKAEEYEVDYYLNGLEDARHALGFDPAAGRYRSEEGSLEEFIVHSLTDGHFQTFLKRIEIQRQDDTNVATLQSGSLWALGARSALRGLFGIDVVSPDLEDTLTSLVDILQTTPNDVADARPEKKLEAAAAPLVEGPDVESVIEFRSELDPLRALDEFSLTGQVPQGNLGPDWLGGDIEHAAGILVDNLILAEDAAAIEGNIPPEVLGRYGDYRTMVHTLTTRYLKGEVLEFSEQTDRMDLLAGTYGTDASYHVAEIETVIESVQKVKRSKLAAYDVMGNYEGYDVIMQKGAALFGLDRDTASTAAELLRSGDFALDMFAESEREQVRALVGYYLAELSTFNDEAAGLQQVVDEGMLLSEPSEQYSRAAGNYLGGILGAVGIAQTDPTIREAIRRDRYTNEQLDLVEVQKSGFKRLFTVTGKLGGKLLPIRQEMEGKVKEAAGSAEWHTRRIEKLIKEEFGKPLAGLTDQQREQINAVLGSVNEEEILEAGAPGALAAADALLDHMRKAIMQPYRVKLAKLKARLENTDRTAYLLERADLKAEFRKMLEAAKQIHTDTIAAAYEKAAQHFRTTVQGPAIRELYAAAPKTLLALREMRDEVDKLSGLIRQSGMIEGKEFDKLRAKITHNVGIYLTRTYEINDRKGYRQWLSTMDPKAQKRIEDARAVLKEQIEKDAAEKRQRAAAKNGITLPYDVALKAAVVDGEVTEAKLNQRLAEFLNAHDTVTLQANNGLVDMGILEKREKIDRPLRELMGQYDDNVFNAARSIVSMNTLLANYNFLNDVKAQLESLNIKNESWDGRDPARRHVTAVITDDNREAQAHGLVSLAGDDNAPDSKKLSALGPLKGYYVTPMIRQALEDMGPMEMGKAMGTLMWLSTTSMANMTVRRFRTHIRNLWGNPVFLLNQGLFLQTVTAMPRIFAGKSDAFKDAFGTGSTTNDDFRKYLSEYDRLGVRHTEVDVNLVDELGKAAAASGYSFDSVKVTFEKGGFLDRAANVIKGLDRFAGRAYQAGDDHFKFTAYEATLAQMVNAFVSDGKGTTVGWSPDDTRATMETMTEAQAARILEVYPPVTPHQNDILQGQGTVAAAKEMLRIVSANKVRTSMPVYNNTFEFVRLMKKHKVTALAAPFISFKAETTRIAFANLMLGIREMKVKETQGMGARRLGGQAAAFMVGKFALAGVMKIAFEIYKAGLGDDEEDELPVTGGDLKDAMRRFLASYYQNGEFTLLSRDGAEVSWMDISYMLPFADITDPIAMVIRERSLQSVQEAAIEWFRPYFAPQLWVNAISEAGKAVDTIQGEVDPNPIGTLGLQAGAAVGTLLLPGTVTDLFKAGRSLDSPYVNGARIDPGQELASNLLGSKFNRTDVGYRFDKNLKKWGFGLGEIEREFTRLYRSRSTLDGGDMASTYADVNRQRVSMLREAALDLQAARLLLPGDEADRIFRASKAFSDDEKRAILTGVVPRWLPSRGTLEEGALQSRAVGDSRFEDFRGYYTQVESVLPFEV